MLADKFQSKKFSIDKADELMRDDFLDKYFKGTYIEWGMRDFLDKAKAANEVLNRQGSNDSIDRVLNMTNNLQL